MIKKIALLFGVILLGLSCNKTAVQEPVDMSFYYWKTTFALDSIQRDYLQDLKVDKLYVRYFDVGLKNGNAIPISPIIFKDSIDNKQIIPVVFIKNEVVLKSDLNLDVLSENIISMINQINKKNNIGINEIQLDCDWSGQSKDAFFYVVEKIKQTTGKTISATIRLHQVKHANKTGIPKVDYGALMYYNMGSISSDTLNSIYDRNIAQRYIRALKTYPLPLKYALPIYSWIVHSKGQRVLGLLQGVPLQELEQNPDLTAIGYNRFLVNKQTTLNGKVLLKGHEIKLENIKPQELKQMVLDLQKASDKPTQEIILYDLNSNNLKQYEKQTLQALLDPK